MTKKHFEAIAGILHDKLVENYDNADSYMTVVELTRELATYFNSQNPRFDKQRFMDAVNK